MKLHFFGACEEVTGSCHIIEVNGHRVLLDCGMIQGRPKDEERNREPFPFEASRIDAVVLSHAHIDHSGRLPLLVRRGFRGLIHCHHASVDLCEVMLKDAAYLNEKDAEWENRKRMRKDLPLIEPLYTQADAEAALGQFQGHKYHTPYEVVPGLTIRFHDAGHILGSAIVEVILQEGNHKRTLVFTGDLGHRGMPLMRNPALLEHADLVLMESTYGNRNHRSWHETWQELGEVFNSARSNRGNILIPAFAVDRTQELLYAMSKHVKDWGLDKWDMFLDSPMAIAVTGIYLRHVKLLEPNAASDLLQHHGDKPLLPHFRFTRTAEESMALNRIHSGAIIMAASGMCSGGRIMHHLKHNAWRKGTHIIIVGYQAEGTIGRALVDGAEYIKLWGEEIKVKARVHTIGGLSSHADQEGLLYWYRNFRNRPPVWLVHGEPPALLGLAKALRSRLQARVTIARRAMTLDLEHLD